MTTTNTPSHFYWDGRCFPSHCTSFRVSTTTSTPAHHPHRGEYQEVSSPLPSSPQHGLFQEGWDDDWNDWNDDNSWLTTTTEKQSSDQQQIQQQRNNNYIEIISEESTNATNTVVASSNSSKSVTNGCSSTVLLSGGMKMDMIILLQRFSYYYLSSSSSGDYHDRFANLDTDDKFVIKLDATQTICASKKLLQSESTFFKLMIESKMKEANENQVDFTCHSSSSIIDSSNSSGGEEELIDILRMINFLRFAHVGLPIKGTAFPKNLNELSDRGGGAIGMVDLLRLLDVADKFGVVTLIESIASVLNPYNCMIILEKALQITPELGTILIDACARVIAKQIPCVLGGLIYEEVLNEFVEQIPARSEEWYSRMREIYKIYSMSQIIGSTTDAKLFELECLKKHPVVNYLIDVLPCEILLKVLKHTENLGVNGFLSLVTLWIMSSSFETCFQDYPSLDNLEKDNIICRLREGLNLVFNSPVVEMKKMSKHSVFLLLHPIVKYYNKLYPKEFKLLYCQYSMATTENVHASSISTSNFSNQIVLPMIEKFLRPFTNQNHQYSSSTTSTTTNPSPTTQQLDQRSDLIELFSQFFLESKDHHTGGVKEPFSVEHANRLVPQLLALSQQHNPNLIEGISQNIAMSLLYEFENIRSDFSDTKLLAQQQREQPGEHVFNNVESKIVKSFEVCMVGLDESGKTLLLEKIKSPNSEKVPVTIPTIGFNSETISFQGAPVNMVDIGGSTKIRGLWKNFISSKSLDLLIMVVDLSDRERFVEAKQSFEQLMNHVYQNQLEENSEPFSILLVGNKIDCIPDSSLIAIHESELCTLFQTSSHISCLLNSAEENRARFKFLTCSAKTGEGIEEMMTWFFENELMGHYMVGQDFFGSLPSTLFQ